MKILVVHNHYQQFGGEDAVVQLECALHKKYGQDVYIFERSNHEIHKASWSKIGRNLFQMHWRKETFDEIVQVIKNFKPDIAHIYNTHFMITPSVYYACHASGVPTVQSLYNYRLICANALLLRDGHYCEECLHHSRWRSVLYRCYRDSSFLTACVVKSQNLHWRRGTWLHQIDSYITANQYSREKFVQAGIARDKFYIKPHFVYPDPTLRTQMGDYALYVGRLSEEKGVRVLLNAWETLPEIPLKVLGTGPLLVELRQWVQSKKMDHVEILGYRPDQEFLQYLGGAKFLIMPSISQDNSPRTILEAYARGVPVLASSLEGIKEMLQDEGTGRIFEAGDIEDLRAKARWLAKDDERLKRMGKLARMEYEGKYTAEKNYEILMNIYQQTLERFKRKTANAKE